MQDENFRGENPIMFLITSRLYRKKDE